MQESVRANMLVNDDVCMRVCVCVCSFWDFRVSVMEGERVSLEIETGWPFLNLAIRVLSNEYHASVRMKNA